jgi:hypothetical protein
MWFSIWHGRAVQLSVQSIQLFLVHSFAGPVAIHRHESVSFLQKMKPELLAVYQLTKLSGCSIPANCCHPR